MNRCQRIVGTVALRPAGEDTDGRFLVTIAGTDTRRYFATRPAAEEWLSLYERGWVTA
jgi:hypothetical protein